MANGKIKQPPHKIVTKQEVVQKSRFPQGDEPVVINYAWLWLALAAVVVYFPTLYYGFTELDDSIFIREFQEYNEDLRNLFVSFGRGVFNATSDPYYRPVFLDSIVINYQFFKQNVAGYHIFNLLFHVASVLLMYKLLLKLQLKNLHAFILALLFAVHPVLSQAVAWIPGRNDTMLAIFIFTFIIYCINYTETGKTKDLLLSVLFLLLAFFTKETAVFAAPAAFVFLVFWLQKKWLSRPNLILYGTWVACFVLWFAARSRATIQTAAIEPGKVVVDFIHRLPLIIQYTGKIFLPVNLSVFPIQQDTVIYYGIAAIGILAALLLFSKDVNWRRVSIGSGIFLLFLLPALLIPNKLNEQAFEHRLYLPFLGMLLVLPETVLFKKTTEGWALICGLIAAGLLSIGNYSHQRYFADPLSFWRQATETSPNSAYANMMLGAREDNLEKSYALFRKAYRLNPKEKYLGYYYGKMLQMQDSVLASEPYLLAEKKTSGYYECDFYLARVAMQKNDTVASANYLQTYLKADPANPNANNNLLLIYMSLHRYDDAKALAKHMQDAGLPVPGQVAQELRVH